MEILADELRPSPQPVIPEGGKIPFSPIPAVNVASVPQRSPLRYPGGKTWLIPHIRRWIGGARRKPRLLVEPFAGGGIVSLTAVMEDLVERCLMVEIDRDVAAFWRAVLGHNPELCERILEFQPTRAAMADLMRRAPQNVLEHGFRTLALNRTRRGGILAPGASLSRAGENGKGLASRWYPQTIVGRLRRIGRFADRIEFREADGVQILESILASEPHDAVAFIDPPYTARGKQAGKRLYAHYAVDHARIFDILSRNEANFLMTYDQSPEIVQLVRAHAFHAVKVAMRTTHHTVMPELIITRRPVFAN